MFGFLRETLILPKWGSGPFWAQNQPFLVFSKSVPNGKHLKKVVQNRTFEQFSNGVKGDIFYSKF